jgi:hypothetical protein
MAQVGNSSRRMVLVRLVLPQLLLLMYKSLTLLELGQSPLGLLMFLYSFGALVQEARVEQKIPLVLLTFLEAMAAVEAVI